MQSLVDHIKILLNSYHHWIQKPLIQTKSINQQTLAHLNTSPFALVSHGTEPDPIFNYANQTALDLFEMTWDEFTNLPSRLSAEPLSQPERQKLLDQVSKNGFIDNYQGVRISKTGKRFLIKNAIVWNLIDEQSKPYGQAAMFETCEFLKL